ncbi:MAG: YebC/PmpR family DNA-binding transcriptional regulator [Gammaproteobacteria bacterium]
MAGHSKWANIQYRKGSQDVRRGRLFTRIIREVTSAARHGGGDPATNGRLKLAIEKANAANVPKDTVERAIRRMQGAESGGGLEEVRYEGYGAGGVAILIECLTDNRNRTVSEIRHAFSKHGGNLGADGAVSYLFRRVGLLRFASGTNEEKLFELALDAGAEDVESQPDGLLTVIVDPEGFETIRSRLGAGGFVPVTAEMTQLASIRVPVAGDEGWAVLKLLSALEELDDVQNLYSNADLPDEMVHQFQDAP